MAVQKKEGLAQHDIQRELRLIHEHQELFSTLWHHLKPKKAVLRAQNLVMDEIYSAGFLIRFAKEQLKAREQALAKQEMAMNLNHFFLRKAQ